MKLVSLALTFAVGAQAHRLRLKTSTKTASANECLDNLTDGTKDYLKDASSKIFTHGGVRASLYGTFEDAPGGIGCVFASMVDGSCGQLQPNESRKVELSDACTNDHVSANKIKTNGNLVSRAEFEYISKLGGYPSEQEKKDGDFSAVTETLFSVGEKEMWCLALFTIDDGCGVQHNNLRLQTSGN